MISIICPIYNEEKYIEKCIDSILNQDYPREKMELLLIDGMSSDNTRQIIARYAVQYPFISLLDNHCRIAPTALNMGVQSACGEVIVRIDAHSVFPSNYVSVLVAKLFDLGADNVGGLWLTRPASDTSQSLSVSIASSHGFGVGNALYRVGADEITEVDTVPFGCFRAEVFNRIGLFDVDLVRNQDDELNARIINNGGKIYLIPEIVVEYFARDKISKMAKMFHQYGLFKPLVNRKLGKPATVRQFFPLVFFVGVVCGGIASFFLKPLMFMYLFVLTIYFSIGLCLGVEKAVKSGKIAIAALLPLTFFVIHMSYGLGYLRGLILFVALRKNSLDVGNSR